MFQLFIASLLLEKDLQRRDDSLNNIIDSENWRVINCTTVTTEIYLETRHADSKT